MFRRAYIGGTFDLLHRGHLALFDGAKQIANEVVVSVNRDDFAARFKRPPVMTLEERFDLLRAVRSVDVVIVNSGDENSGIAIERASADVIVHGDDWTGDGYLRQLGVTQAWLDCRRIAMRYLPYTKGVSSSELLRRIDASMSGLRDRERQKRSA